MLTDKEIEDRVEMWNWNIAPFRKIVAQGPFHIFKMKMWIRIFKMKMWTVPIFKMKCGLSAF